jgi:hypothetical protein
MTENNDVVQLNVLIERSIRLSEFDICEAKIKPVITFIKKFKNLHVESDICIAISSRTFKWTIGNTSEQLDAIDAKMCFQLLFVQKMQRST